MNTGNDTIYSLHSRFSCYVVLPNGNHDYVRCQTTDGIVSGEYKQETEGLYQLFVRDYMYQMTVLERIASTWRLLFLPSIP